MEQEAFFDQRAWLFFQLLEEEETGETEAVQRGLQMVTWQMDDLRYKLEAGRKHR